ncbi:MAG: hypothetical protein AABW72_05875 [archaeon]
MGIYDNNLGIKLPSKGILYAILAILVLVILWLALTSVMNFFKPQALQFSLSQNELQASGEDTSTLTVILTNVSEETKKNVNIEITASIPGTILINSKNVLYENVSPIAKKESRQLEYVLRANPANEMLAGNYTLSIKAKMDKEEYTKEFSVKVVK